MASPAPSLPLSLASPLLPLPLTSLYPLTPEVMTYRGQTSSTPLLSSKLPFSISNILGERETEIKQELDFSNKPHTSYSQNSTITDDSGYDSSKLGHSQVTETEDTEDSYIDVVGLDEGDEELTSVPGTSIINPKTNSGPSVATNIVSEPLGDTSDSVQTRQELRESGQHVFDIKKKMFDNWSKSKQSQHLKEAPGEEERILGGVSEYRHKKIRRASHENHDINNDEDSHKGVKKKTFVLDKYELNSNINKNKRKEEKWSQSETDSPEKKKDQHKLKKKHKPLKEERWKISKTLQKSPVRLPPASALTPDPAPRSGCSLGEADLLEGLRLLLRVGSHFYAGGLREISAPDIYGIIIDKERGSKPHIFSRQEIIRDAVSIYYHFLFLNFDLYVRCYPMTMEIRFLHHNTEAVQHFSTLAM